MAEYLDLYLDALIEVESLEPFEFDLTLTTDITVTTPSNKKCNKFVTIGWIKDIKVDDGEDLIPLAVSDLYGDVIDTDKSITFRVHREGDDYRLTYNNSKSKLIRKTTRIQLNDGKWHFIGFMCKDDYGNMGYYVDDKILLPEDGVDENNLEYSVAYNVNVRVGGGYVYCPALYKAGQKTFLYNWRCGIGFILNDTWVKELYEIDKSNLGV
jgi:hypothetical protein